MNDEVAHAQQQDASNGDDGTFSSATGAQLGISFSQGFVFPNEAPSGFDQQPPEWARNWL